MTRFTLLQTMISVPMAALAVSMSTPSTLRAQAGSDGVSQFEARLTGGAFLPAGTQRDHLKSSHLTAAQVSWLVRPSLAVTTTIGWARSRSLLIADTPKLDVLSADMGLEYRMKDIGGRVSFAPFVGAGVGGRSYNSRARQVASANEFTGYAALGGELGVGRVGLRVEARGYAAGSNMLASGASADRVHDVVMMIGLRFNRHAASR